MENLEQQLKELRAGNKQLETARLMELKDHNTKRALLNIHISNLEKQLTDREMVLRECQESMEADLRDAKAKDQALRSEKEAKINQEREGALQKIEEMTSTYEQKIRELKDDVNQKHTVRKSVNTSFG